MTPSVLEVCLLVLELFEGRIHQVDEDVEVG
jgi:hypothetical protein